MSLEHILLGFLETPASGYELKKQFEDTIRHFWSAELAQIYPALHGLRRRKLVTCDTRSSGKGPDRKVYRRTAAGTRELFRWLESSPATGKERFTYLAQVFFLGQRKSPRRTRDFLQELRAHFQKRLAALRDIDRYHRRRDPRYPGQIDPASLHYYLTLRCGLLRVAASVRWCDESLRLLRPAERNPAGGSAARARFRRRG